MDPFTDFLFQVKDLIDIAIPVAFGIAFIFFVWGLAVYILRSGDEKAKEEGRNRMIWGVVAIFVITSIWGIVGFLGNLFGIGQGGVGAPPGVENPL